MFENTEPCLLVDTPRRIRKGSGSEPGQWLFLAIGMWRRKLKKGWKALSCTALLMLPADTFQVNCPAWAIESNPLSLAL